MTNVCCCPLLETTMRVFHSKASEHVKWMDKGDFGIHGSHQDEGMMDAPGTLKTLYIWLYHQPLKECYIIRDYHLYCPCQQCRPPLEKHLSWHSSLLMHFQPFIHPLTTCKNTDNRFVCFLILCWLKKTVNCIFLLHFAAVNLSLSSLFSGT